MVKPIQNWFNHYRGGACTRRPARTARR
jgi:hypothetical protein